MANHPSLSSFRLRALPAYALMAGLACLSLAPKAEAQGAVPEASQEESTLPLAESFKAGEALTLNVALDTLAFLNGGYPIDSSGYADLPVIGKLYVAGRTRDELEKFLGEKLSNYLKDTHITAIPSIRITWLGHWVKAGQYYVSPQSTVWDAVRMAGGIAGERNIDKLLVRRGDSTVPLSFFEGYSRGTTLVNAGIRSGDIVIIPVPRDDAGFWYWFRESLSVTAELATILISAMSVYVVYVNLEQQNN